MTGDDRNEQRTVVNLLPNLPIPRVPTPKLALVEPHLDGRCSKRFCNALRGRRILRCIAQEDSTGGCRHRLLSVRKVQRLLDRLESRLIAQRIEQRIHFEICQVLIMQA